MKTPERPNSSFFKPQQIARLLLSFTGKQNDLFFSNKYIFRQLHQRLIIPDELRFRLRYKLLQDQLLELKIPGFQNDLSYQHVFLDKLDQVYRRFQTYSEYNQMVCRFLKGLKPNLCF